MKRTLLWLVAGVLAAAIIPSTIRSPYYLDVLSYAVVLAIYALGVAVVFGQLGYATFGHAAFFGIGAYTAGLLVAKGGFNYWSIVALSIVPGAALGALLGLVSARLSGAYFAIATLTVAELLGLIAGNWDELTRGPMGTMVTVAPLPFQQLVGWNAQQSYPFILIVALALTIVALDNLFRSPTGRSWIAIREAPALAEALGIPTKRARVLAVTVSGAIAALAGALFVPKIYVISPDLFGIGYSATGILAVIFGGKSTLLGPVIGGAVFAIMPELFRPLGDLNFAAFALIMLLAVRLLPGGIVSIPSLFRFVRRTSRDTGQAADVATTTQLRFPTAENRTTPLLEVSGLSKSFGGIQAISDISFVVRPGEIVGLIGPNGAGKTTLFNILTGFQPPDAGTMQAFGSSIAGLATHQIAQRGLVRTFQQTSVCNPLTVFENAMIATHLANKPSLFASLIRTPGYERREQRRRALALSCLTELGLDGRRNEIAGSLPYGEKKLLGVALALAAEPALLLLDEPAAGLNQVEAQRLATELRKLRDKGLTLIVVDHNLAMLMGMADRIIVLHHGIKIDDGAPVTVTANKDVIEAYLGKPQGPAEKMAAS